VRCHVKLGRKDFGISFFIFHFCGAPHQAISKSLIHIRHDVFCAAARRIISRHYSFSMTNPLL
jgi:hypothetical protein